MLETVVTNVTKCLRISTKYEDGNHVLHTSFDFKKLIKILKVDNFVTLKEKPNLQKL